MAGLDRKRGADFIAMLQEIGGKVGTGAGGRGVVCLALSLSLSYAGRGLSAGWLVCGG
jgi:hypothetical protein